MGEVWVEKPLWKSPFGKGKVFDIHTKKEEDDEVLRCSRTRTAPSASLRLRWKRKFEIEEQERERKVEIIIRAD